MGGTWGRNLAEVFTYRQDYSDIRALSQSGNVTALKWSHTCPGGPAAMSCTLQVSARVRTPATDPGRWVRIFRGASVIWEGQMDEPAPGTGGSAIVAHGAGTFGNQWRSWWSTWNANNPVDAAIVRGLKWQNPGISGAVDLTVQPDPGAQSITEHLNAITDKGAMTWMVGPRNRLRVFALPTTVTRLLIATAPVARTIAGYVNALVIRYKASADSSGNATYATTNAWNPRQTLIHGWTEEYIDLSNASVMSAGAAQAVGYGILAKYRAASYGGPFVATPGQVLTTGGTAVDLGCERAGEVYQILFMDQGWGGEVGPAPVTFIAGQTEYDDVAQTLTITPYVAIRNSFSALAQAMAPRAV